MGRERRRFERIDSHVAVRYASVKWGMRGHSLTKDCSEGGLGLAINGKIPEGERLNLEIKVPDDRREKTIPAVAKVVWARRNLEHWKCRYSAGLRFLTITPGDKNILLEYVKMHRWIKSDFERALEENKVPILGRRGVFLL